MKLKLGNAAHPNRNYIILAYCILTLTANLF